MIYSCDIEDFEDAFRLVSDSDLSEGIRMDLLGSLVLRCSRLDFDRVHALVHSLSMSGAQKNQLIRDAFGGANIGRDRIWDAMESFEYEDERRAALEGLRVNFRIWHEDDLPDLGAFPHLNEKWMQEAIGSGLGERLLQVPYEERARVFDESFSALSRLMAEGKADDTLLTAHLGAVVKWAPEQAFRWWLETGGEHQGEALDLGADFANEVASGLVKVEGGAKALDHITSLDPARHPQAHEMAGQAYWTWLSEDFTSATRWLDENVASLDAPRSDQIIKAVVQLNLQNGEPDFARQWAERISDSGLRSDLAEAISNHPR